jgi:hypothetical protein
LFSFWFLVFASFYNLTAMLGGTVPERNGAWSFIGCLEASHLRGMRHAACMGESSVNLIVAGCVVPLHG